MIIRAILMIIGFCVVIGLLIHGQLIAAVEHFWHAFNLATHPIPNMQQGN